MLFPHWYRHLEVATESPVGTQPTGMLTCFYIFTAHKQSLRRLCFHRCLSVHSRVCMVTGHAWWGDAWQRACIAGGCVWQGGVHGGGMHGRGVCMVGGHAWQGGMHGRDMHGTGGMRGRGLGVGVGVHDRGHVWQGSMHGRGCKWQGVCMAGDMYGGEHVWQERRPLQQAVRILLECILVLLFFWRGREAPNFLPVMKMVIAKRTKKVI